MQISQNLPQFSDENVLIIVSSTQSADIYRATDGTIEKLEEIRTEKLDTDGQKSHFERSTGGKTLGAGGVEKDEKAKLKDRFNKQLRETLSGISAGNLTSVILLSSSQDKAETKEQFPAALEKLLAGEINGNHVGEHPDEILEKIQNEL